MPVSREDFIEAGLNDDQFLVGPALILVQHPDNFAISGTQADGMPRWIDDIVDMDTGVAMSANGWRFLGHTENITPLRSREIVTHDSDQATNVEVVHDRWSDGFTLVSLETSEENLQMYWQGDPAGATNVVGAPTPQTKLGFGDPSTIVYQRAAIIHPDKFGVLWVTVYRRVNIRATSGPTYSRTGRVEWTLEALGLSDRRGNIPTHERRKVHFKTTAPVTGT